jgi:ribosomal protein L11 methyltransferase
VDWQEVAVELPRAAVQRAEALLELAGASALSFDDAGDEPVLEPGPGETPLWPRVIVRALFPAEADLDGLCRVLRDLLPDGARPAVTRLTEAAWRAAAARRPRARAFGSRLWLSAADETCARPDLAHVRLHMGLAFGTGEHPTTSLCLDWLAEHLQPGCTVLDYGCGSGVLAIAALALGAREAVAIDNDPQALVATARNAALNGVEDRLLIAAPEEWQPDPVDVLLANILAGPLVDLAGRFARYCRPAAALVLSGALEPQVERVIRAYEPDFEDFSVTARGGWARIDARRKPR